jgi:hypothetical protein
VRGKHVSAVENGKFSRLAEPLRRVASRPTFYTVLRACQLLALGINALLLARLFNVDQYALYARGAFFATLMSAVAFLGQDFLAFQRRIDIRTLKLRLLLIEATVLLATGILAALTVPSSDLPTIISSCIGTAGIGVVAARFLAIQLEGRDGRRAVGQLLNALTVQLGAVLAAAIFGAGAFQATTTATVISLLWAGAVWKRPGDLRSIERPAPFRDGLPIGIGGFSYASLISSISVVVAVRANNILAAQDRFILLTFAALLALTESLNSEYFRVRLFDPAQQHRRAEVRRAMVRSNIIATILVGCGIVACGILAPYVLPSRYGDIGVPIAELAAVVPLMFASSMLQNIELSKNRIAVALSRNFFTGVFCLVAALFIHLTPSNLDLLIIVSEASGFVVLGLASLFLSSRLKLEKLV